ncbi:MAG TPA: multiheme c-type cytochrome [Kofleriaceae bacterium]|nr:multiheme c-type cytochrome [Kofleriaceae bacterium]
MSRARRLAGRGARAGLAVAVVAGLAACGDDDRARPIAELQDPATCQECHPRHFQDWSGSMHAYASDDPVFVAMNQRGQRETGGALGTFCVQCHAPMAVKLGLTDGTRFDPAQLPPTARGVTCYFCHNVASIADTHNNGLVLADDQTLRGGVKDPVRSPAHRSAYDARMDSDVNQSEICGACHDVVTPRGVALERTYQEWQTTFFSEPDPQHHLTCGACHMPSSTDVIADAPGLDVRSRTHGFHEHQWPAIDQALTAFPELAAQAAGIQRDLDPAIAIVSPAPLGSNVQPGGICLDPPDTLSVRIDSIGTAHAWPSGAAQDRRAWLEVIASDKDGNEVFTSGVVPDGPSDRVDPEQIGDPNLLGLWDRAFKDDGTPAHFFWDIATLDSSNLLRPPVTLDKNSPLFDHATVKKFSVAGKLADIARITARVRIRPLSYAMLDDLVTSGDLSPDVLGQLHTLDILGARSVWTVETKGTGPAMFTNCNPQ